MITKLKKVVPGIAVLVSANGSSVYETYTGLENLLTNMPITPITKFRLASLTKPITALSVLLLIQEKKLQIDDPLSKFYPSLPNWSKSISISNLLTHSSGIPEYEECLLNRFPNTVQFTMTDVFTALKVQSELLFPPQTKQLYSESGYVMLAEVIEKVTGSFSQYLTQNVFVPLKMSNSILYASPKMVISNRALGYQKNSTGYSLFDDNPLNFIVGNEGVYSTAPDLMNFCAAWFTPSSPLNAKLQTLALSPIRLTSGETTNRGFSWKLSSFKGLPIAYHGGSWVGFRNMMCILPTKKMSVIFLSNSTDFDSESQRLSQVLGLLRKYA